MWTLTNAAESFSLFIAPNYLGSGNRFSRSWQSMISKLQYNTCRRRTRQFSSSAAWLLPDHMFIISRHEVDHIIAMDIYRLMWYTIGGSIRRTDFGRYIEAFALMSCEASFLFSSVLFVPENNDHIAIILYSDLTTSLTINRTGAHGDKSAREYEKAVFA